MENSHGLEIISSAYDYLERFNYIKESLEIGWGELGRFYDLNLRETEMLIREAYFGHGLISSGVGNQDFFIADQDYPTMIKTLFSLVDKGLLEIDTKNEDGDTFYYSYFVTEEGMDIYNDIIDKYDKLLEGYERDKDRLVESYGQVIDNLNYLLDDLRVVTSKKNIEAINEAQLRAMEDMLNEADNIAQNEPDGFYHGVASVYRQMLIEYNKRLAQDYEDVKMGMIEPIEGNNIVVHALVIEDGKYVEKEFLFFGNDVKNYRDITSYNN
ncbi:hypothetical protein AB9Q04_01075 [Anaerococcus sp. ENR1011]|uniref:Uncharacterized protein n=1 Tax=Anaerococcus groningensis TaxID=3115616 RepID=A0ABW9MYQ0_9FIRM